LRALLTFRPKDYAQWRIHTLTLVILDTGCRIQELLGARTADFDLPNLLLTVYGKGRKERRVPFSLELRKALVRFAKVKEAREVVSGLMFPNPKRDGLGLSDLRS
jgi:integrase/recombinase XerD